MERQTQVTPRKLARVLTGLSALTLSLGVSSCASNSAPAEAVTPTAHPVKLKSNMVGFLEPGSSSICYGGLARPCAILLRTAPELSSDIINTQSTYGRVKWPQEPYAGSPGDNITVECYDPHGQLVRPYEGNSSSTDWYEVAVPESHVLNPVVKAELREHSPAIETIKQGGQVAVVGWASVEWFHNSTPNRQVSACTS